MYSINDIEEIMDLCEGVIKEQNSQLKKLCLYEPEATEMREQVKKNINRINELVVTGSLIRANYVSLDADHNITLLESLRRYTQYINEKVKNAELDAEDYAFEKYCIGYMQGKLELGFITPTDMDLLEEWFEKCK